MMSHAQVYDITDRLLLSTMRSISTWLTVSHLSLLKVNGSLSDTGLAVKGCHLINLHQNGCSHS
jgi:hypothetical protein